MFQTPSPISLEDACRALEDPADEELLREVRKGDQRAASQLYERYFRRLVRLTDNYTGPDLSTRFDAEDVIQSVFGSFFNQVRCGLYEVPVGGDLWPLLLVIALQKIRRYRVRHRAAKRDVRRECRQGESGTAERELRCLESADPEPHLSLLAKETLELMPERYREIVLLRLEGYEHEEIAQLSGRSKRSIERMFQECRQLLQEMIRENHNAIAGRSGSRSRDGSHRQQFRTRLVNT
jgi:RNA polymerase sigma-70 factor (ECF subfamily)